MKLDILLTTTNKSFDEIISLINKLHITSNVVIGNQFKEESINNYFIGNQRITVVNTKEKGCSRNRNNLLKYTDADIVVFADDDEVFVDNYEKIIISTFSSNPLSNAIYFAVNVNKDARPVRIFNKSRKAKWKDVSALGVWGLAIKRSVIDKYNLRFDDNFGPGAKYPMGEDSIYLCDAIKRVDNFYTSTSLLAYIEQYESTWFRGYDKSYFINLAIATKRLFPHTFLFHVMKNVIYYTMKGFNPFKIFWWMIRRK